MSINLQKPRQKLVRFFAVFPFLFLLAEPVSAKTLIFQTKEPEKLPTIDYSASEAPAEIIIRKTKPKQVSSPNSELFFMIEQLQQELGQVRSLVEEQANQIHHLKRNAKSRYLDLDSRVLDLSKKLKATPLSKASSVTDTSLPSLPSSAVSASVPGTSLSSVPSIVPVMIGGGVALASVGDNNPVVAAKPVEATPEQKQAYQAAYALIKAKKYEEAVEAFDSFIVEFPEGNLTGNAYYWLGEVYLVLPQLEQARQAFSIVVSAYPGHGKVADALFKLGVSYDRLQDPAKSEIYLNQVQKKFPKSTAAKLAKSYKINR